MAVKSRPGFFATRSRMAKPRVSAGTIVSAFVFCEVITAAGTPGSVVPSISSPPLFIMLNGSSVFNLAYHVKKSHAMKKPRQGFGQVISKERGSLLFVNKKKQKNFAQPGRVGFAATGSPQAQNRARLSQAAGYDIRFSEPLSPRAR